MQFFQMKSLIRLLFIFVGISIVLGSCKGREYSPDNDHKVWKVKDIPKPVGIKGRNFISDPDHLLAPSEIIMMNDFIREIKDSTGLKIRIVVVDDIGRADIHVFTDDLYLYWHDDKDNKVLLMFIAADQMLWSYESGDAAKQILPELTCNKIAEDYLASQLRQHQYSRGITDVLYVMSQKLDIDTDKESSLAYQLARSPLPPFRNYMNWLMVVYISIIVLIYNHKRKERSFAHLYFLSYTDQQAKVMSYIPFVQWVIQYVMMPALWLGVLYIPETAEYPGIDIIMLWLGGVYVLMLCWLTEHRLRVNRQLMERTKDDPALLYTRFLDSHKGWMWSAVFFPFPFAFYYIWYGRKVKRLRNLTKPD
jgi:uncharacterized membrane protein YgcG